VRLFHGGRHKHDPAAPPAHRFLRRQPAYKKVHPTKPLFIAEQGLTWQKQRKTSPGYKDVRLLIYAHMFQA
jgi:hypothetical protein